LLNLLEEKVHLPRQQHQQRVPQQKEHQVELQCRKIYQLKKKKSKLLLISPKR